MRILVEPSDYILRNVGDMAMLHIAVTRLGKLWPEASIEILSDEPENLPAYCQNSKALSSDGRNIWFNDGLLFGKLSSFFPYKIFSRLLTLEKTLRRHFPFLLVKVLKMRLVITTSKEKKLKDFLDSVSNANLLLVSGMGGITDFFPEYAVNLLETRRLVKAHGALTVMVGQGIGPINNMELKSLAKDVLTKVDFILLRESLKSVPLLNTLGVPSERIMVTGDDAIELAYQRRKEKLGAKLGINLRLSEYSNINKNHIEQIRDALLQVSKVLNVEMIPVPISNVSGEADLDTISQLIGENQYIINKGNDINIITDVFEQINLCKVVVTGSYHAGVFALASGIPAVCVANSEYYVDKFLGLANQFGTGCKVVFLNQPDWLNKMIESIKCLWKFAEEIRPTLLEAAEKQIELSLTAYRRIYNLVESKKGN